MMSEPQVSARVPDPLPRHRAQPLLVCWSWLAVAALAWLLGGCASPGEPERSGGAASPPTPTQAIFLRACDHVEGLLESYAAARGLPLGERLARESALAREPDVAVARVQRAMLLAGSDDVAMLERALSLLESVPRPEGHDACMTSGFAELLADLIRPRLELALRAERLAREVDSGRRALAESREEQARLREKLDALAEIERSLPARPQPDPVPVPTEPEAGTTGPRGVRP